MGDCVNGRCLCNKLTYGTNCHMLVAPMDLETNITDNFYDSYLWLSKSVDPKKKYQLKIGSTYQNIYTPNYKVCVGEEKESIANEKLSCYYSTYYDQEYGPFEFTQDTAYIAIINTQRKTPYINITFDEYQETQSIKQNAITVNLAGFCVLVILLVLFFIALVAILMTPFLKRKCQKNETESDSSIQSALNA